MWVGWWGGFTDHQGVWMFHMKHEIEHLPEDERSSTC